MEITLKLTQEETLAIVQVLGQLPTSSNAYPLMVKIRDQIQPQLAENNDDVV